MIEKKIMSEKELTESLELEISNIAHRLDDLVKKYKQEQYTIIPNERKKKIFDGLLKANEELGKLKMSSSISHISEEYRKLLPKSFERDRYTKSLEIVLINLSLICADCYNRNFVNDVFHLIDEMEFIKLDKFEEILDGIKCELSVIEFIKSSKEFDKVVKLMNLIYIYIKSSYSFLDLYKLIGVKTLLLEFETAINIINEIEEQSLKNAIIDYISDFVDFKVFYTNK